MSLTNLQRFTNLNVSQILVFLETTLAIGGLPPLEYSCITLLSAQDERGRFEDVVMSYCKNRQGDYITHYWVSMQERQNMKPPVKSTMRINFSEADGSERSHELAKSLTMSLDPERVPLNLNLPRIAEVPSYKWGTPKDISSERVVLKLVSCTKRRAKQKRQVSSKDPALPILTNLQSVRIKFHEQKRHEPSDVSKSSTEFYKNLEFSTAEAEARGSRCNFNSGASTARVGAAVLLVK
nr:hypothetical protein Iba_chr07eCG10930 [Ipomoea batatas]